MISRAGKIILMFGAVSLLADVTYEGARSIAGPFLGFLGASGTAVGLVAGLGELIGYGLRAVTGYWSDRTKKYWLLTIGGYAVNLLAVPALALAGRWEAAAALMIAERLGKAVRTPARDTILSSATREFGHGKGFGLHEAMDQVGAMLGPVIVAAVLHARADYRYAFGILLIPALAALAVLFAGKTFYPRPSLSAEAAPPETSRFPRSFRLYLAAVSLTAAGFADFALVTYHWNAAGLFAPSTVALIYAGAMGVDALAALLFGYLFDRIGINSVAIAAGISLLFAPLVFLGGRAAALAGILLWGIGLGAQESIMRSAVAVMSAAARRGTAYGIFNAVYGVFWFAGSALMGVLYDRSLTAVVVFSVAAQGLALPVYIAAARRRPAA